MKWTLATAALAIDIMLFAAIARGSESGPAPGPLYFCDPHEYKLDFIGPILLKEKLHKPAFVYKNSDYFIYMEPESLLKLIETDLAWMENNKDVVSVGAKESQHQLLSQMQSDLRNKEYIDLKKYGALGVNIAYDLQNHVGTLLEAGNVIVVDNYVWCGKTRCPRQLKSLSKYTVSSNDIEGIAFCDPGVGMIYFKPAPPAVY